MVTNPGETPWSVVGLRGLPSSHTHRDTNGHSGRGWSGTLQGSPGGGGALHVYEEGAASAPSRCPSSPPPAPRAGAPDSGTCTLTSSSGTASAPCWGLRGCAAVLWTDHYGGSAP